MMALCPVGDSVPRTLLDCHWTFETCSRICRMSTQAGKLCIAKEDLLDQLIAALKHTQDDIAEHGTFAAVAMLGTAATAATAPTVGLANATIALHKLCQSRKARIELEQECGSLTQGMIEHSSFFATYVVTLLEDGKDSFLP